MRTSLILASGSSARRDMLTQAGVAFEVAVPRVDEESIRDSMVAANASPRDVVDALAEMKARRVSEKRPGALVIGSDQILVFDGKIYAKPESPEEAVSTLHAFSGSRHELLSAAVIYDDGEPVWRHIAVVRLQMHTLSDAFLERYVARNWESIRHTVGAYKIEEEGVRLFSRVDGSHFAVLGLPLLEVLSYLGLRGVIET